MSLRKTGFGAHVDDRTRVVILGSLPGERSLEQRRYYAHNTNQFWKLAGSICDHDLVALEYELRIETLLDAGIGLWDVVKSAHRTGSGDAAITQHDANPLAPFAQSLPNLRALAFNGATAAKIGRMQVEETSRLALIDLPSSSAAHAAMPLAEKQQKWSVLRPFLLQTLQPNPPASI